MTFTPTTAIGIAGGIIGLGIIASTLVLCYYAASNRRNVQATKGVIFTLLALTGVVFAWALFQVESTQLIGPRLLNLSGALACEFAIEVGIILLLLFGTSHQVFTRRMGVLMEKRRREERRRNPIVVVQVPSLNCPGIQVVMRIEPQVEVQRPTRFEREEVI
jgi:hypothetical protein